MSNKLENFISDNRNEFDDAVPSGKVWKNIENAVFEKKSSNSKVTPFLKWTAAAAILVTAGITIGLLISKKGSDKPGVELARTDTVDINAISPEYAPQVNQIARLVAMKQDELKALAPEQPELYRQFTSDITQLDSSYHSLRSQLNASPNPEMLIEAMIQNLQLQLNVLNQQLSIINQFKQTKKYSHENAQQI